MASRPGEPNLEDIDALLRFLPLLERPDFLPGTMPPTRHEGGVLVQPASERGEPGEPGPGLTELVRTLYDHGWVFEFDWPEWQSVAERYVAEPGLLADVGIGTLRKLFTTHVRKDRFCDGHLAAMVRSGHVLALLRRLQQIRQAPPR